MKFDVIVVGAGITGITASNILSNKGKSVLLVDERDHIGGLCYDSYNKDGVFIQNYGAHIFHTRYDHIWKYLSQFTDWRRYTHEVKSLIDLKYIPFPPNKLSLVLLGNPLMTSNRVFKIFYEGYSKKQWGKYYEGILEESPDIILGRCSVRRNSCDCRYFTDEFQGVPLHGYTNMFNNMLRSNKIKVLLKTSAKEVLQDNFKADRIIYTGSIDEWYNYRFGKLEYRGMRFDFETYDRRVCSPYPVINYPDEEASFTRTVEFKHITGQEHDKTTVMTEFPCDDSEDKHYPIYDSRNLSLVAKYKKLMKSDKRVASGKLTFMGRLGSYSYLNMDQCVHTAMYV